MAARRTIDQVDGDHGDWPTRGRRPARPLVVRLRGGAGNQLFQYAAARSLVVSGTPLVVRSATTDQLSIEALLPGELQFVDDPPASAVDRLVQRLRGFPRLRAQVVRVHRRLRRRSVYSQRGRVGWAYEPRPPRLRPPRLLEGYFQHVSWLTPGGQMVVDDLLRHSPAGFADRCNGEPYAAVCTRRGDYEALGYSLGRAYYDAAIALLDPALPVVLVGDDRDHLRDWAGELTEQGRRVIELAPLVADVAVNDFWLAAAATSVVMANSSFCWWAATVGDRCHHTSAARVVCFPAAWIRGHGTALRAAGWTAVASG